MTWVSAKQFGKKRNLIRSFTTIFLVSLTILSTGTLCGQIGGRFIFDFITIPNSARATALGDYAITVLDGDVALGYQNPSLLNKQMHQAITFNHNFYLEDVTNGYFSYGHHFEEKDLTIHSGAHYINYGEFDRTDVNGVKLGTFKASEVALIGGIGKQLYERLRVGANLRFISSTLEGYTATGIGIDLAATYTIEEKGINLAFVIKNAGFQLSTYNGEKEQVPFDVQLGFSKRLKHLPFRLYITAHTLNRWDVRYDDPNQKDEGGIIGEDPNNSGSPFFQNLFGHLVFGGEFLLGKQENVALRLGFNDLRRQELSIQNYRTLTGFSFGFGFKISKFKIDYGFSKFHLGAAVNHLSISTNIGWFSKKVVDEE